MSLAASVHAASWYVASLPEPPDSTINDFIPVDRDLSECISALPKPGCGSAAKGDWPQQVLFGALLVALAFIAWRIVAGSRKATRKAAAADATPRPPA